MSLSEDHVHTHDYEIPEFPRLCPRCGRAPDEEQEVQYATGIIILL